MDGKSQYKLEVGIGIRRDICIPLVSIVVRGLFLYICVRKNEKFIVRYGLKTNINWMMELV